MLVDMLYLVRQKHMGGGKITKIILLFYCISNLSLDFDKNNGGGGQKRVNL